MERDSSPHDNIDVKVNSRINVYGNVTIVGSISVAGVGFLFLAVFMFTHWAAAVTLAAVLVYGLVGLFGLTILALVAALWLKIVIRPGIEAHERRVEARAQEMRNLLIHVQPEGAVLADPTTKSLRVVPFLLPPVVEADEPEKDVDAELILEFRRQGHKYEDIMKWTGASYYQVQKICSASEPKGKKK